MDLKVPYGKVTDKKQAYELAKKHVPEAISKFGVKANVDFDDAATSMKAKGTGFDVKISFTDKEVQVSVDLSFLLKPLKGKVLETLEKQLKKVV